ncbi:ParB/RepB/Spo0J family partition protein [Streptomyces sp. NPDC004539]|uniref:ParB/RepB/Spo0J family partition protein n=1 Tax=Streptomyces sp. NPDC004539 TaxID=3154280 RepID=UPI0033A4AF8E
MDGSRQNILPKISPTAVNVAIDRLVLNDSPRLQGEDAAHIKVIAEVEDGLPPILVHRETMQVIDGMHRVRAAIVKGRTVIAARFFDGDEKEVFLLAVKANIEHGLPLSLTDRKAAAMRIIHSHAHWSDRAIAEATSLSARTIASLRPQVTTRSPQLNSRFGQDGRVRPVSNVEGRRRVAELIAERPEASLREVAREAGVSPNTVRRVREHLQRGEDPAALRLKVVKETGDDLSALPGAPVEASVAPAPQSSVDWRTLSKDPAICFSEAGRFLLRSLSLTALPPQDWERILKTVPSHRAGTVSALALECSRLWEQVARNLEASENSQSG